MKRLLILIGAAAIALFFIVYTILYFTNYSEGVRSGELIKLTSKGVLFKTWEGEISQGIAGAQLFQFSITDDAVVGQLENLQGKYVKITYIERYTSFFWLGDSRYFATKIEEETPPYPNTNY